MCAHTGSRLVLQEADGGTSWQDEGRLWFGFGFELRWGSKSVEEEVRGGGDRKLFAVLLGGGKHSLQTESVKLGYPSRMRCRIWNMGATQFVLTGSF